MVVACEEGSTMIALISAALAGSIVLAAADAPPTFDIDPSCQAAAKRATTTNYLEACRQSEARARQQLVERWPQFSAKDRAQCVPASSLGGKPTYSELITCLEMTQDAANLRSKNPGLSEPTTTGQGASSK
jgi:hypothetical protein